MSLKDEFRNLFAMGDTENLEAFGRLIRVCGVSCRGMITPLDSWYELKTGAGLIRKVNMSCRVPVLDFPDDVKLLGSVLVVEGRDEYRVERVKTYDGDPCYILDLSRLAKNDRR